MLNKLEMLRIFCTAAETSSFKEAAIRLGLSPQAVGRAVKDLEIATGEVLFFRSTRQSQITEHGIALAQKARSNIDGIDALFSKQSKAESSQIKGLVRIAAPTVMSKHQLGPMMSELLKLHPELQLHIFYSDEISDVVSEKIDVGIRVGFMRDSQLIAKTVSQVQFIIVGTPALIARVGAPQNLDELNSKPVTVSVDARTGKPWPWFLGDGEQWHAKQPVLATNDSAFEFDAVLSGTGFGQIASILAMPHIQTGQLVQVLPEICPAPWNVHVYRTQKNAVPARVRVVFDYLVAGLSTHT